MLLTNIERLSLLQAAPFHELDPKLYKSKENKPSINTSSK